MLPGKKYKPEDFLWMVWRRKWLILIPALLVGTATYFWSRSLPDRYRSSALVLVIPQKVPESYVRSTVTASVAERLQTITPRIVSRTRLERLIDEFGLYPEERRTMIMEDVVETMRTQDVDISVPPGRRNQDSTQFTVAFEYTNPRTAMLVADRLASMFVQESLEDRTVLADSTDQFMQAQLEDARRRLLEHEKKLEEFRLRNSGQLPEQSGSNIQLLQVTQSQLQANAEAQARETDRLTEVENLLADAAGAVDQPLGSVPAATSVARPSAAPSPAQQLAAAKEALQALEARFKPSHPDVVRGRRVVAEMEAKVAEAARSSADAPVPAAPISSVGAERLAALKNEAARLRQSVAQRQNEDQRLRRSLGAYAGRVDAAPKLQSELTELMRDYGTLEGRYKSLLQKSEDSKLALNLERRQIGEQFRVIDSARLPAVPTSPNRMQINLQGIVGGFALGFALVALLIYRDTTFKTDDDIVSSLSLPVLAVIPAMTAMSDRARKRRRRLVMGVSMSVVTALLVIAIVVWQFETLKAWVR